MVQIKNAKIWKFGHSYVVTIDKPYIDNGQLIKGKRYRLELTDEETEKGVRHSPVNGSFRKFYAFRGESFNKVLGLSKNHLFAALN